MNEDAVKIRLKVGQVEVEYEGEFSLLKDSSNPVDIIFGFYEKHVKTLTNYVSSDYAKGVNPLGVDYEIDLSISTIADRLGVKDTKDLVMAAMTYFTFVEKKDVSERKEILDKMKEAPSYYTQNMSKNLSNSLKSLIKQNRLNQNKKGFYCLSPSERKEMETKLISNLN